MTSSDVAEFIMNHPDSTSLDIAAHFGITVSKSFTVVNSLISDSLAFRTSVRSPTNRKRIYGYRMVPGYDKVIDNGDGSMKEAVIMTQAKRAKTRFGQEYADLLIGEHNRWRRANGIREITQRA